MGHERAFSLGVVRLPGELTGSGTTCPTTPPHARRVTRGPWCGFTPEMVVPRLPLAVVPPTAFEIRRGVRVALLAHLAEHHQRKTLARSGERSQIGHGVVNNKFTRGRKKLVPRFTPAPLASYHVRHTASHGVSRGLDHGPGYRRDHPQRRHQPRPGQHVEGAALVVVEAQLGGRPQQNGHHAVVTRGATHHTGVTVDSRRHGADAAIDHRQSRRRRVVAAHRGSPRPPADHSAGTPSPASFRATISMASLRPHQRQLTDSTVSTSTSVCSTRGSPARSRCQNSDVRRVRTTSNRVRLPQPAQRQRWVSSGKSDAHPSTLDSRRPHVLVTCAAETPSRLGGPRASSPHCPWRPLASLI